MGYFSPLIMAVVARVISGSRNKRQRRSVPLPSSLHSILVRLPTAVTVATFRYLDQSEFVRAMQTCHTLHAVGLQPAACVQLHIREVGREVPLRALDTLKNHLQYLETVKLTWDSLPGKAAILEILKSESRSLRRLQVHASGPCAMVPDVRYMPLVQCLKSLRIYGDPDNAQQPLTLFGCVIPETLEHLSIYHSIVVRQRLQQLTKQFPRLRSLALALQTDHIPDLEPLYASLVQIRFTLYRHTDAATFAGCAASWRQLTGCSRAHLGSLSAHSAFMFGFAMPAVQRLVVEDEAYVNGCRSRHLWNLRVVSPVLSELVIVNMNLTSDLFEALAVAFGDKTAALTTLEFRDCIVSAPCNWLLLDPFASLRHVYLVGMFVDDVRRVEIKRMLARAEVAFLADKTVRRPAVLRFRAKNRAPQLVADCTPDIHLGHRR